MKYVGKYGASLSEYLLSLLCNSFSGNRILSFSLVVILCLVYIRFRFPVLFKSVIVSDVTILKNPWAIELKMEMLLWRLFFMLIVL